MAFDTGNKSKPFAQPPAPMPQPYLGKEMVIAQTFQPRQYIEHLSVTDEDPSILATEASQQVLSFDHIRSTSSIV